MAIALPTFEPPWKLAMIGVVAVITAVPLLLVDWALPQLAAYVATVLVTRGALHAAATSFDGPVGALSALWSGGEIVAGLVLMSWPEPSLFVVSVVVGGWTIIRALVDSTVVLASRAQVDAWKWRFARDALLVGVAAGLIALAGGPIHDVSLTLGALAVIAGGGEMGEAITRLRNP